MKQQNQQQLEDSIRQFNQMYKVGDNVEVMKLWGGNTTFKDEIRHEATIMGGHTAMTWLVGHGSYDLRFVKGKIQK